MTPSDEQQTVINAIRDGYNVQVDAVAGSGKTTTILSLADQLSDKIIIQLTYNAELKDEVIAKKEKYGDTMYLDGLSIYTYHGLATKFYSDEAKRDIGISRIVSSDMQPRRKLPRIHILAMDEIQDMNELYYTFIRKFIKDIGGDIQLLILGDVFQGLYEFKGADTRFLTYAPSLWRPYSPFPFQQLKLTTSYRVTNPIASFVNDVMLGEQRIKAQKYGHNVLFIRHTNPFESAKIIAHRILGYLKDGDLKPDDIFVLSASVKSPNSPLKKAENILVSHGVPCYTPMNETCSIKSNVIKNKVIFASFHQSKGRERKLVIVFGFDQSYFEYYNRDADPSKCPSTLYVAATRATETLIVIETGDPLSFLQYTHREITASPHTSFVGVPLGLMSSSSTKAKEMNYQKTSPSNLIKFMNESLIVAIADRVEALFKIDNLSYPPNNVILQGDVDTTYGRHLLWEEVFDINGLAIPAIFEEMHSPDKMSEIKRRVQEFYAVAILKNTDHLLVGKIKTIDFDNMSVSDYLKMANIFISLEEHLHFKVAQINYYNWLSEKDVAKLVSNMGRHIEEPTLLQYEETIVAYEYRSSKLDAFIASHIETPLRFIARVDAMSSDTVWEFKCVDALEIEHFLQVIIYAWLWRFVCEPTRGPRVFKIMNIRTAEVRILNYDEEEIEALMGLILKSKYQPLERLNNTFFAPV